MIMPSMAVPPPFALQKMNPVGENIVVSGPATNEIPGKQRSCAAIFLLPHSQELLQTQD